MNEMQSISKMAEVVQDAQVIADCLYGHLKEQPRLVAMAALLLALDEVMDAEPNAKTKARNLRWVRNWVGLLPDQSDLSDSPIRVVFVEEK